MDAATQFIAENFKKTHEIFMAIRQLQTEVLGGMGGAIENSYTDWLGEEWTLWPDSSLLESQEICVTLSNLILPDSEKEAYLWLDLQLEGEDAFWKMFGFPSIEKSDRAVSYLILNGIKTSHGDTRKKLEAIDALISAPLGQYGYIRKGGISDPYYECGNLIFDVKGLNKGLDKNNWDEVILPLRKIWEPFKNLPWNEIEIIIKEGVA